MIVTTLDITETLIQRLSSTTFLLTTGSVPKALLDSTSKIMERECGHQKLKVTHTVTFRLMVQDEMVGMAGVFVADTYSCRLVETT